MYGLVLEGGGSRGAYQIGACKAINEMGLEITMVAGTSVGALNGAMVVQGDVDRAYEIWHDMNPDRVMKIAGGGQETHKQNDLKPDALKVFMSSMRKIIENGGLNVDPLVELVKSVLDEDRIRESPIGFGVVTVDITQRKAVEIYKEEIPVGQLADYVIASASFPAFKRAVIDGKVFIDGGLYNVLPINMVSNRGYKDIVVIRTYGMGMKRRIDTSGLNIINISPVESLGSTMNFSTSVSRKNLQMGYYDAYKEFRKLKGTKYYVTPKGDERFYINYLANLSDDKVFNICRLFGSGTGNKRMLFEEIIPKMVYLLDLPAKSSYEDVTVGLLERAADSLGIERFRFYTVEELYDTVLQKHMVHSDELLRESSGFMRSRELLPKAAREKMINNIANELFM